MTLPQLARETGVTIARFERLVEHLQQADDEHVAQCIGIDKLGSALLMRHLWLRSSVRGKRALWTYLATLHKHYGPVLASDVVELFESPDEERSRAWIADAFNPMDLAPPRIVHAAASAGRGGPRPRLWRLASRTGGRL